MECDREITIGRRTLFGGIKYVCSTEADIVKCKEIQTQKRIEELNKEPLQEPLVVGKALNAKCLKCNHEFYSFFPMESLPPCDHCPKCKSLVYDDHTKYEVCDPVRYL